jgi:tetratricopeptide (TPR) repeat protein
VEYLASLGKTLKQQERFEEAFKACDKAVQLKPDDPELWYSLGNVLIDLKRLDDALLAFKHILTLDAPPTSLQALSRILDVDATFISLQKDPRPDDQATLREHADIIDLTADLTDLSETAALVSCLDLVITVDTSVAHLAAALGRPTWFMLAHRPDFRWLLDREDSPRYPTMRLFRQTKTRDYTDVAGQVRTELSKLIAARPALGPRFQVR